MLINCGECKKVVSDKANVCPSCGNPINRGISGEKVVLSTLVECSDCGKSVSSKARSCPNCGNPDIGGVNSAKESNISFEKRIEEYKENHYRLLERSANSVVMVGEPTDKAVYGASFLIALVEIFLFIAGLLVIIFVSFLGGAILVLFAVLLALLYYKIRKSNGRVVISINTLGKIEESGNVLKK